MAWYSAFSNVIHALVINPVTAAMDLVDITLPAAYINPDDLACSHSSLAVWGINSINKYQAYKMT